MDFVKDMDGYKEIENDIKVLRKYARDYSAMRGNVKSIIDMLHPYRLHLRVSEIREETPSTKTLRLVSVNNYLPPFQAGQYINVFVDITGVRTSRPYSISSSPAQRGYYDITVRKVEDGFVSNYLLEEVKVGQVLESTAPAGNFYYNPLFHGNDLVFLAGGSGITPFMSMIREVTDRDIDRKIHLVYGSQFEDDVIFQDELEDRSRRHENFSYNLVLSSPPDGYKGLKGFITEGLLKQVLGDIKNKMFYICGPKPMYTFCMAELEKLGIEARKIRLEISGPPKDITAEPGWPRGLDASTVFKVKIRNGKTINAKAGEPLMVSLERAGIVVEAMCRSGECSMCRTKLLDGKVFHPQAVKLRKSDRDFGYIHPCVAYPIQDLEIML
ncbi:MAG: hypothetical protein DRG37_00770 [Deltaproteobacteria bacterium]|nr:MAG: hypothetical protein DRG37_00770 [Deltaproteobacteria bacterium]